MSFEAGKPFTAEEINLIEGSGLTIGEVENFWSRFPDQNLDTAIAGCLKEKSGDGIAPLQSALQDEVPVETARGEEPNQSSV